MLIFNVTLFQSIKTFLHFYFKHILSYISMDKYFLALLGEAGAAGLDRGFSIRYKVFWDSYLNEKQHWIYFRKYRRSILEKPIYYIFMIIGVVISLLGIGIVKRVNETVEKNAIDFYVKYFDTKDEDIRRILDDERRHLLMSKT